jgi:hypothetical protein
MTLWIYVTISKIVWISDYLPHAQTAIYDSKVKLFLKQGISRQLGRGRTQLFDLNARIQQLMWSLIFYEKYSTSISYLWIFSSLCKTRTGTKLTSFQNKNLPITNYVQTQTSVMFSNISMIIMYYEYMTTKFFSILSFLWTTVEGPRQTM